MLLEKLIPEFSIDTNRIYVVGMSDGVLAARSLQSIQPGIFAGAGIGGGGIGGTVDGAGTPTWVWAAPEDAMAGRNLVRRLLLNGGNPIYTEYLAGGHADDITMGLCNPVYSSLNGVLFNKDQTTLIGYPVGRGGSYKIPGTVTEIKAGAFYGCTLLSGVEVTDRVTSIGDFVFFGCTGLTSVTLPNTVTSIGYSAFGVCSSLTNINIPEGVKSLGDVSFLCCTSLVSVRIPDSVATIGDLAFSQCASLASIVIPNNVTSIGGQAFAGCVRLADITIPNSVTDIGAKAFEGCDGLTGVFFGGFPPAPGHAGEGMFDGADKAVVHYLPGSIGWTATIGGRPTTLWSLPHPVILAGGAIPFVKSSGFGFIISWATNGSVAVDAATSLSHPVWSAVGTNTLSYSSFLFSDPGWASHPGRFYRLSVP